jgi:hypothetical protein
MTACLRDPCTAAGYAQSEAGPLGWGGEEEEEDGVLVLLLLWIQGERGDDETGMVNAGVRAGRELVLP